MSGSKLGSTGLKTQLTVGQRHQAVGALNAMIYMEIPRDQILEYLIEKYEETYAKLIIKDVIDNYMEEL
jgi:hypothetical protein